MALATIAGAQLTAALKPQLALLVDDIRTRLESNTEELQRWRATHRQAVKEKRTAGSWIDWSEDQLTQAAVGWLLTSVFVRFCEDNLLLGDTAVWIAGPDPRLRQRAHDAEIEFYRSNDRFSYREWLDESFNALRDCAATQALVDEHAGLRIASPSSDAVHDLLAFWRQTDDDGGLVWSFRDDSLSTRFLGDLYQDLSDFAKKKYALLQTPEFVEEFILDRTLEPALKERPLEGFKIIDPTCGSGHFLLGAFARLVERWHHIAPGLELRTRVDNALASVYGVDLNPFAVAIAKFRLIVAALHACGEKSLVNAPKFTLNLAAGDSLLHGAEQGGKHAFDYDNIAYDKDARASSFTYTTEDADVLRKYLAPGQYDVVVGNPPYITVKDSALNVRYREIYHYCSGKYALTVPFMERFFQLAKAGRPAGWTGQITSNSFMKREFGVRLITEFLAGRDLTEVIDCEGAWIPGHNMDGTPTVILIGRNRAPASSTVRTILSLGLRERPDDAPLGQGPYWTSLVKNIANVGYQDDWISVVDLPRKTLNQHPWSLSGGGAVELLDQIDRTSTARLGTYCRRIGFFGITGDDSAMVYPAGFPTRHGLDRRLFREYIAGDELRDYTTVSGRLAWFPYSDRHEVITLESASPEGRAMWPVRTSLGNRATFGGGTYFGDGRVWYEWHQLPKDPTRVTLVFSEIATHNHFLIDRRNSTFKHSAQVVKFNGNKNGMSVLSLLGTLNSSIACFWMKQKAKAKGGAASHTWARTYDFTGSVMLKFPLPRISPIDRSRRIDSLAQQLAAREPKVVIQALREANMSVAIGDARRESTRLVGLLITEQEELDWEVYYNYDIMDECLTRPVEQAPAITLGERAFEISLARKLAGGESDSEWFAEHHATRVTETPTHWPTEYRELVEKRLTAIESNPFIRLLERPEYKRRWAGENWDTKLQRALKDWLLDRLEDRASWFTPQGTPQPRSIGELAGHVEKNAEFIEALDLWAGQRDAPVASTLVTLLADEAVPYLPAMRYNDSGLRKRTEWERVWDMQRDADHGLIKATEIPVPPKYTSADFVKQSYWSHRGKLDVPKERFITYPGAGRATDPTPLLGWAGWNHAQQGLALATIYALRESEGIALDTLVPLVAGIAEVLPWVKQWHTGADPNLNVDLAEYLAAQLAEKSQAVGVAVEDLPKWRPTRTTLARKSSPRKALSQ